jgi:hypothetical protein
MIRGISLLLHSRYAPGQSLVIVALSFTALMAMIGLGVDIGYLIVQRRIMYQASDAAALSAAAFMVTHLSEGGSNPRFDTITEEDVWRVASLAITENQKAKPAGAQYRTKLSFIQKTGSSSYSSSSCGDTLPPCSSSAPPPPGTIIVRVESSITFKTSFIAALGIRTMTAGAVASARMAGDAPQEVPPAWPFAFRWAGSLTANCAPRRFGYPNYPDICYWDSQSGSHGQGGNYQGLLDYTWQYNPRFGASGNQDYGQKDELSDYTDLPDYSNPFPPSCAGWDPDGSDRNRSVYCRTRLGFQGQVVDGRFVQIYPNPGGFPPSYSFRDAATRYIDNCTAFGGQEFGDSFCEIMISFWSDPEECVPDPITGGLSCDWRPTDASNIVERVRIVRQVRFRVYRNSIIRNYATSQVVFGGRFIEKPVITGRTGSDQDLNMNANQVYLISSDHL